MNFESILADITRYRLIFDPLLGYGLEDTQSAGVTHVISHDLFADLLPHFINAADRNNQQTIII
mgnify:CR=1 FL=1